MAKKRISRIKLAAASNVLLPCGVWKLALDKDITDAHILCRFASDNSQEVAAWQLGHKPGHAVVAAAAKL